MSQSCTKECKVDMLPHQIYSCYLSVMGQVHNRPALIEASTKYRCAVDLVCMNSMKLVIPLHSLYWSIHTKDESKRETAFAFIFGVN